MIDSWYYASCVKFRSELFNSHHLLFNILGVGWLSVEQLFNEDPVALDALMHLNAFAASACLFILYSCLTKLGTERNTAFWFSIFCGSTFGFMRYATDAETYILPLLFSLISTYFFIGPWTKKSLFASGFFATTAILIHQLHIWWALAMFLFLLVQRPIKFKDTLLFCLPFLLVPCIYYFAFLQSDNQAATFYHFITGEYSKGNAGIDLSLNSILLTFINFIRTFFQIHGMIANIFFEYTLISICVLSACLGLVIYGVIHNSFKITTTRVENKMLYSPFFLIAFLLHLLFALISSGNAEFMVMLPFLIVLYAASKYRFENIRFIKIPVIILMVWNLSFAIIPNSILDINRVELQARIMEEKPEAYFLWRNKPLVENVFTYYNGFDVKLNFIEHKTLNKKMLDTLLNNKKVIITDISDTGIKFSRESLLSDENTLKILKQYHLDPYDSFINLYAKKYIYLVQKSSD